MIELSIIIPNYQTDECLFLGCLNSIISRCENEIEIIVVDDGSQDSYRDYVYGMPVFHNERIKVILKDNGGVSSARNRGLIEAKGRYVAFVDADDIVLGEFVKESLWAAEKSCADIVIGGMVDLGRFPSFEQYSHTCPISCKDLKIYSQQNELISLLLGLPTRFSDRVGYIGRGPVAKIIRSELAKRVYFQEDLTIYEDTLWNMNIVKIVNSACVVEHVWYGYHNTVQSASKGFHVDEVERSTKGMYAIAEAINLSDRIISKAFREQCIVEYHRIVNTYFLSKNHNAKTISIMKDSMRMLHSNPWDKVRFIRDLQGLSFRMKIYGILYITNAWIPVKLLLNALPNKLR